MKDLTEVGVEAGRAADELACAWQVRATHGAAIGTYYYEATITQLGDTGHCRLGWSSAKGELQGPVSTPI